MPRTRTTEQNRDYWNDTADRYERYANGCKNPDTARAWFERAAEARDKAATYTTTPAP